METHFEKYLDSRFARIEEDVRDIRSDIKEMRRDIHNESSSLKKWFVASVIAMAALFFSVVGYQTMVMQLQSQAMQSQMAVFSDYVKAVTQPQQK